MRTMKNFGWRWIQVKVAAVAVIAVLKLSLFML